MMPQSAGGSRATQKGPRVHCRNCQVPSARWLCTSGTTRGKTRDAGQEARKQPWGQVGPQAGAWLWEEQRPAPAGWVDATLSLPPSPCACPARCVQAQAQATAAAGAHTAASQERKELQGRLDRLSLERDRAARERDGLELQCASLRQHCQLLEAVACSQQAAACGGGGARGGATGKRGKRGGSKENGRGGDFRIGALRAGGVLSADSSCS